ncbi:MAG: hypothetical protein ACRDVZ_00735 [Jiangellaceae bacterium]
MDLSDLDRVATTLDGVIAQERDGLAHWRYHGPLIARQLDSHCVVVRASFDARDAMVRQFPDTFSVPPRFAKHMRWWLTCVTAIPTPSRRLFSPRGACRQTTRGDA